MNVFQYKLNIIDYTEHLYDFWITKCVWFYKLSFAVLNLFWVSWYCLIKMWLGWYWIKLTEV